MEGEERPRRRAVTAKQLWTRDPKALKQEKKKKKLEVLFGEGGGERGKQWRQRRKKVKKKKKKKVRKRRAVLGMCCGESTFVVLRGDFFLTWSRRVRLGKIGLVGWYYVGRGNASTGPIL